MAAAKNTTNPSSSTMRGRIPATAIATTKVLPEAAVFSLIDDFEADDSGAMQLLIADDSHETFLVAFSALIAWPWPKGVRVQTSQA